MSRLESGGRLRSLLWRPVVFLALVGTLARCTGAEEAILIHAAMPHRPTLGPSACAEACSTPLVGLSSPIDSVISLAQRSVAR